MSPTARLLPLYGTEGHRESATYDGSRDQSDISTSHGTMKIAGQFPKPGESHRHISPSVSSEGTNCADTLISGFYLNRRS